MMKIWSMCGQRPHCTRLTAAQEEERGSGGQEGAKGIVGADPIAEGCVRSRSGPLTLTDLTELDLPSTMKMDFPDPADTLHFNLSITPDEGASLLLQVLTDMRRDV